MTDEIDSGGKLVDGAKGAEPLIAPLVPKPDPIEIDRPGVAPAPSNPVLEKGDIVFVSSDGIIGYMIRRIEQRSTHDRSYVNHVAMVVEDGPIFGLDKTAVILDAQPPRVSLEKLSHYQGELVSIYRPKNLSREQKERLAHFAVEQYNGHVYGFSKIALHWLGLQRYATIDKFPICSWTVAVPMNGLFNLDFGTSAREATPESIWDFCRAHPQFYAEIVRLGILEDYQISRKAA
jgi:hypothetical protein